MARRKKQHLLAADLDVLVGRAACGRYIGRRPRLSERDRAQRRVRVRRVAQVAASLGVCIVCGPGP